MRYTVIEKIKFTDIGSTVDLPKSSCKKEMDDLSRTAPH